MGIILKRHGTQPRPTHEHTTLKVLSYTTHQVLIPSLSAEPIFTSRLLKAPEVRRYAEAHEMMKVRTAKTPMQTFFKLADRELERRCADPLVSELRVRWILKLLCRGAPTREELKP